MSDTELFALAVLAQCECGEREWANETRRQHGQALAYEDTSDWPTVDRLAAELRRRQIIGE